MATSTVPRLASVTARDGVDTRKKDNCGTAAAVNQETTRLGAGDQIRVGQLAASYRVPPGADIVGSQLYAAWENYLRIADAYVYDQIGCDGLPCFQENPFWKMEDSHAEDVQNACRGRDYELNLYRRYYNLAVTEFRKTHDSRDLETMLERLAVLDQETEKIEEEIRTLPQRQANAIQVIKRWVRSLDVPRCPCGDKSMFEEGGLCVDCHWTEDGKFKTLRRQNAVSPH
jgi:hypothetical protein